MINKDNDENFNEIINIELNKFLNKYKKNGFIDINIDFIKNFDSDIYENIIVKDGNIKSNFIFDSCILTEKLKYNENYIKEFIPSICNIISYYILCNCYDNDKNKMKKMVEENFDNYKNKMIEELDSTYLDTFEEDADIIKHITNGLYILNIIVKKIDNEIENEIIYIRHDELNDNIYIDGIYCNFLKINKVLNNVCYINNEIIQKVKEFLEIEQYNR